MSPIARRQITFAAFTLLTALALDLNSYRAQHHRPRLTMSAGLAGIAKAKARELAGVHAPH